MDTTDRSREIQANLTKAVLGLMEQFRGSIANRWFAKITWGWLISVAEQWVIPWAIETFIVAIKDIKITDLIDLVVERYGKIGSIVRQAMGVQPTLQATPARRWTSGNPSNAMVTIVDPDNLDQPTTIHGPDAELYAQFIVKARNAGML